MVRVQLHQNLKARVRFGFIETNFLRFGSGSLNPNFKGSGSVRVHRKKKRFLPVRGSGSGSVRLPGGDMLLYSSFALGTNFQIIPTQRTHCKMLAFFTSFFELIFLLPYLIKASLSFGHDFPRIWISLALPAFLYHISLECPEITQALVEKSCMVVAYNKGLEYSLCDV